METKTATTWISALMALAAALAVAATMATGAPQQALATKGIASALAAGEPQQFRAQEGDIASGTWGSCPWEISADGVLTIHPGMGQDTYEWCPWADYVTDIRSVVCAEEGGSRVVAPADCSGLFALRNVESMDLSGLDTSNAVEMGYMFAGCSSLSSLDVSSLDTSKAEYMGGMFSRCSSLTSLDLSGLDTSKVEYMGGMFYGCSSLASLDVSSLDTSKVTTMYNMFGGCSSLTSLDVSSLDTSKVESMESMFDGCSSLASLDVSGFDTSKVENMLYMFSRCSSLASLDVSGLDTSNALYMAAMFSVCSSLTSLDVSGFDTSKAVSLGFMFSECSSLERLATGAGWTQANALSRAEFPVSMANEAGAWHKAGNTIPDGAHVYTEHAAPVEKAIDSVALSAGSFAYDGKTHKPRVASVKAGDTTLVEGDYAVAYSNPSSKNAGTYEVTVTAREGSGFTGSASATYKIKPAVVTSVALSKASSVYTGKVQKPAVLSVKAGALALKAPDYTVAYQNSKGKAIAASAVKAAGTYRVVVTGKGNFTGTKSATFKVTPAKNGVTVAKSSLKKGFKASALKKKEASVSLPKATAKFGSAKWKVTKKDGKKVLNLFGNNIKVKKGAKKGTYTIELKASVAKTANYGAASSKAVTVRVTVR